ncbi:MAG TPA: hypothetical protein VFJ82_24075 [Longimicrobium sp.]|nr:hypothetical protein [Longimicrobium sp.]
MLAISACGREGRAGTPRTPVFADLNQVVTWERTFRLEENQSVINVSPWVTVLPSGEFLVSDGKEQQLRFYAPDGRLRGTFGRRGSGPGEFQHLARAVRLNDGTILAADMMGEMTRFDSAGARVLGTAHTSIGPLYELLVLNDSTVLIIGRKSGAVAGPLLHEWNLKGGRIMRSYFAAPQGPPGFAGSYAFTGFANADVRGDTVAVLFALEDTVRLFDRGRQIGKVAVPFRGFRKMETPLEPDPPPERFRAWWESYSTVTDLYWLRDGTFLVQYADQLRSDRRYSLLHMSREGTPLWEASGSPNLLTLAADESLVFVKPGAEAPNEWSIATLTAGR